jgi:sugar-specific transcriptional regulator TrmB
LKTQEDAVNTLEELGLTMVQAKTYLAIIENNVSTIKEIASTSKVARTDLYRSIRELEEKGLVERVLSKPNRFQAVPIGECVDSLYRRIVERNIELQKKIAKLRNDCKNNENKSLTEANASKYVLVPKSRAIERIGKAIDSTKEYIDVVSSWKRFSTAIFSSANKLEHAWSRGVECRFVIEKPESLETLQNGLGSCRKNPHCRIRFIPSSPRTVLSIYDGKEGMVIENPIAPLKESSILLSNNRSFISMIHDFFEIVWITAKEDPFFQTDTELDHDKSFRGSENSQAFLAE